MSEKRNPRAKLDDVVSWCFWCKLGPRQKLFEKKTWKKLSGISKRISKRIPEGHIFRMWNTSRMSLMLCVYEQKKEVGLKGRRCTEQLGGGSLLSKSLRLRTLLCCELRPRAAVPGAVVLHGIRQSAWNGGHGLTPHTHTYTHTMPGLSNSERRVVSAFLIDDPEKLLQIGIECDRKKLIKLVYGCVKKCKVVKLTLGGAVGQVALKWNWPLDVATWKCGGWSSRFTKKVQCEGRSGSLQQKSWKLLENPVAHLKLFLLNHVKSRNDVRHMLGSLKTINSPADFSKVNWKIILLLILKIAHFFFWKSQLP